MTVWCRSASLRFVRRPNPTPDAEETISEAGPTRLRAHRVAVPGQPRAILSTRFPAAPGAPEASRRGWRYAGPWPDQTNPCALAHAQASAAAAAAQCPATRRAIWFFGTTWLAGAYYLGWVTRAVHGRNETLVSGSMIHQSCRTSSHVDGSQIFSGTIKFYYVLTSSVH